MKTLLTKYKNIYLILLIIGPVIIGEFFYYQYQKKKLFGEYQKEIIKILDLKENILFQKYLDNNQKLNSAKRFINYMFENEMTISEDSGKFIKINASDINQSYKKYFVLPAYKIKNTKIKSLQEFAEQELYIQNVFSEIWQKSGSNFIRIASGKQTDLNNPVFINSEDLLVKEILKGNEYFKKNLSKDNFDFSLSFPIYLNGKIAFFITLYNNENLFAAYNNDIYNRYGTDFLIDKNGKLIYKQNSTADIPNEINISLLNFIKTENQYILNSEGQDLFLKYIPEFEIYIGIIPNKEKINKKISQIQRHVTVLTLTLILFLLSIFFLLKYFLKKQNDSLLLSFSQIFSVDNLKFNSLPELRDYIKGYYNEVSLHIKKIVSGNHQLNFNDKYKSGELISGIRQINNRFLEIKETEKKREEQYKREEQLNKTRFEISEILQQTNDIEDVSLKIIKKIASFISADQIAFFMTDEDFQKKKSLKMTASFAWSKERTAQKVLNVDEGLTGRAYLEKETVYLTEIPDNYTFIESGFGFQKPNWLLIIPFIFNNEVQALIELAGINPIQDYKIKFLEDVGETIASAVANLKHSKQTEILLKQTTEQSVEIEEQRKTLEEKINTHRKQNRNLDKQILQLIEIIDSIKSVSYLVEYDTKGNIMDVSNKMINLFESNKKDFISYTHKDIVKTEKYSEKYKDFWQLLAKNKVQYIEETININNKQVTLKQTYVPIKNVRRKIYRILSVGSIKD